MVPLSDGTMSFYADGLILYRPIYWLASVTNDIDNLYVWFDDNFLEEYNPPSPLHLSRLNKYVQISWGLAYLQLSIGLYKSVNPNP